MISRGMLLIVEPDDALRLQLEAYFTQQLFDVITVRTGEGALHLLTERLPTVIITEVDLGGEINGWEFGRMVRDRADLQNVALVFATQRLQRLDRIAAFHLGADDFITKPYDFEELELRVDRTIRRL